MTATIRSIFLGRFLSKFRGQVRRPLETPKLNIAILEDGTVPAAFFVNSLGDVIDGTGGTGNSGDLRYCITQANLTPDADTITFNDADTKGQTVTMSGAEMVITQPVSIIGPTLNGPGDPSCTIDGIITSRHFNLNMAAAGATVSISNLRLFQGNIANSGGSVVISSQDDIYNFTDVIFDTNIGGNYGGAVGCVEPLANTLAEYGTLNFTRAKFLNNKNTLNFGGALALNVEINGTGVTKGYTCNIIDSTFDNNQNDRNGGALFTRGYNVTLNVENSTFSNNKLVSDGFGGTFSNLSGAGAQSSKFTFTNCTFSGNSNNDIIPGPPAGNGGAGGVFANGGGATPTVLFRNSTFTNNFAAFSGGVAAASSGAPALTFESCILFGNTVGSDKGFSEFEGTLVSAKNSIIRDKSGAASFTDLGGNKIGATFDPLLQPLGNTLGGLTHYHIPGSGSPARENGFADPAVTKDQRGAARLQGSKVDIGSIESQDPTPIAGANVTNVLTAGGTTYSFTVTYSDDVSINTGTLGTGDVTVSGPNGFTATPTFKGFTGTTTPIVATYEFTAPVNKAAGFDVSDNGVYTVTMVANEVSDKTAPTANFVPAGPLATFNVAIPQTFTVNKTTDNDTVNGEGTGLVGDLRYAIVQSNLSAGIDTITFDKAVFGGGATVKLGGVELAVTDSVNITGIAGKVTISGESTSRVMNVSGPGSLLINLSDLILANGSTTGNGGAISLNDEVLNLTNVTVTGSKADGDAGGIVIDAGGGKLFSTNSTFSNNSAALTGGAVATNANAFVTFNASTLENNTAGTGGAIDLNLGNLTINSSVLAGNSASLAGGAIHLSQLLGLLLISNSTLANNIATNAGGAIDTQHQGGTLQIRNSTIAFNSAGGAGGGINHTGSNQQPGNIDIVSSIISDNTSSSSDIEVAAVLTTASVSLLGGTSGGGVFTLDAYTTAQLGQPTLIAPLANYGGPTRSVGLFKGSPAVDKGANPDKLAFDQRGSPFVRELNGTADIGAFEGVLVGPSGSLNPLGPIIVPGPTPNTLSITYTDDTGILFSSIEPDDIQISGPGGKFGATSVSVDKAGNGTPRIATYTFTPPGGAWDFTDNGTYTVTVLAGEITDTDPAPSSNVEFVAGNFTVAIPIVYTVDVVSDVDDGNTTKGNLSLREAIGLANNDNDLSEIAFDSKVFGGAQTINFDPTPGQMTISKDVTITGPTAKLTIDAKGVGRHFNLDDGLAGSANVTISNLTLTGGSVTGTNKTGGTGGSIFSKNENLTLNNVTITGNTATEGGAISNYYITGSTIKVFGSTISSNVANEEAGGIYVGQNGTLFVHRSTFSGNTAKNAGGGVYFVNNGGLSVVDSTVSGNSAAGVGGGGLYFFGTANATGIFISNSTISGNTAGTPGASYGGGLILNAFAGKATIQNSTIVGNSAGKGGGGFGFTAAAVTIQSSIIAGNSNNGSATDPLADLFGLLPATVTGANNLIGINDPTTKFTFDGPSNPLIGTTAAKVEANVDPLALNGAPAGTPFTHALQKGSLAIDAGNNKAGLDFDQRGPNFIRVSGVAADIGAFEVQSATPVVLTPLVINAGQANTVQRSRILTIDINFGGPVSASNFQTAGLVELERINATPTNSGAGTGIAGFDVNTGNGLIVSQNGPNGLRLTFANILNNGVEFSSLADGRWRLRVTPAGFVSDDTVAGQAIRRLYGDNDANQTTDGTDFGFFGTSFGGSSVTFDFDNNGTIDGTDFGQFGGRIGVTI